MFTMEEMLSKRNQRDAFTHFETKKDGCGADKMRLSQLPDYWELNKERIMGELMDCLYQPGVVLVHETINGKGKKRSVSSLNVIDRYITRLLSQKLKRYLEPEFLDNSYAYQDGKGVLEAVRKSQSYISDGDLFVAEIDIKDFFDSIPIEELLLMIDERISDKAVVHLIKSYLYCSELQDNRIVKRKIGVVQGNSISPILSNLYLHPLDVYMEEAGYHWVRFADNINIYSATQDQAIKTYEDICGRLESLSKLEVNSSKSGVFDVFSRQFLGYEFYRTKNSVDVRKHQYRRTDVYHNWHPSALQKIDNEYHIIQNGVLNKHDYSLLFENSDEKHHIPVEAVNQINFYNDVTVTTSVLKTISSNNIKMAFFNRYGDLMGYYIPEGYHKDTTVVLKQCEMYRNEEKRLFVARQLEVAGIHNMRSNLRYYYKKNKKELRDVIDGLGKDIYAVNKTDSINALMLIEARARQKYYYSFDQILVNSSFKFTSRTRQPPMDELNAMISFGNTLLYNLVLQIIWKTSLDPRIGVIHAANRRNHSLNLDFADLFKPVITDRVIFSLINRRQIIKDKHFERRPGGGVYLNNNGKKIFIQAFEYKLSRKITVNGKEYTYQQLIENEVQKYKKHILIGEKYKPYKYY